MRKNGFNACHCVLKVRAVLRYKEAQGQHNKAQGQHKAVLYKEFKTLMTDMRFIAIRRKRTKDDQLCV